MKRILVLGSVLILACGVLPLQAQRVFTLAECRDLALSHNKQLLIAGKEVEAATNLHRAAHTDYLPKLSAEGGYRFTSREVSLLNGRQKSTLNTLGTTMTTPLQSALASVAQAFPDLAPTFEQLMQTAAADVNGIGQDIRRAFRTNTRNLFAGAITLSQPVYLGGKIRAYDRLTGYAAELARQKQRAGRQDVILSVDEAYWTVVMLRSKYDLALSYQTLLRKLDSDVTKMIEQGVATRADGLTVSVRLNEADMQVTKADDGLTLARMALWQLCGRPLESTDRLADEGAADLATTPQSSDFSLDTTYANRPDLHSLETLADMAGEQVKIARSGYLPNILATGNYVVTNPSLYNGFERKFRGMWALGLTLQVPIFNWFETRYKLRAAKAQQTVAYYTLDDAREKVALQVNQASFRVKEAWKRYRMTLKDREKADENLRTAQLGFREGVVTTSNLLEAQTAWLNAQSEKIDAEIDVKLTKLYLEKSQGVLR